jgi:cytochrome c
LLTKARENELRASKAKTREFLDMDDSFNTAAGWVLFAGIIALGTTIVTGEYFHAEAPEKGGYAVADAAPAAGPAAAAKPINFAAGDPAKGAELFSKCASCHSITAGGANGQGPNLHGIMGQKHARTAGFAYSTAMVAMPGVWDWAAMDKWLTAPKKYVEGTKMAFAGLSNPEDRANLIRYINDQGSNMPVPAAPAEAAPAVEAATGGKAQETVAK